MAAMLLECKIGSINPKFRKLMFQSTIYDNLEDFLAKKSSNLLHRISEEEGGDYDEDFVGSATDLLQVGGGQRPLSAKSAESVCSGAATDNIPASGTINR
jgi:hypothetical protein